MKRQEDKAREQAAIVSTMFPPLLSQYTVPAQEIAKDVKGNKTRFLVCECVCVNVRERVWECVPMWLSEWRWIFSQIFATRCLYQTCSECSKNISRREVKTLFDDLKKIENRKITRAVTSMLRMSGTAAMTIRCHSRFHIHCLLQSFEAIPDHKPLVNKRERQNLGRMQFQRCSENDTNYESLYLLLCSTMGFANLLFYFARKANSNSLASSYVFSFRHVILLLFYFIFLFFPRKNWMRAWTFYRWELCRVCGWYTSYYYYHHHHRKYYY